MARTHQTPEDLEKISRWLAEAAERVDKAIVAMRSSKPPMTSVLIHMDSVYRHYLPQILGWSSRLLHEIDDQKLSHEMGISSSAERDMKKAEKQKNAAKKASKKRAGPRSGE